MGCHRMNLRHFIHTLQICYIIVAVIGLFYVLFHSLAAPAVPVTEVAMAAEEPASIETPETATSEEAAPEAEAVIEEVTQEPTLEEPETSPSEEEIPPQQYTYVASHNAGRLFIRSGPSLDDTIIGFMRPGSTGDVLELGQDWSLIQYNDIQGYTFNQYLTFIPVEE